MAELNDFHKVLQQLTFWRIVFVLIVIWILRTSKKYFDILKYHREITTKYGGKSYFHFPVGFPARLANPEDSLLWDKQSLKENPKWRLFASHFGTKKMVSLIDPALIKDFLSDQSRYRKAQIYSLFNEFIGKGLVFSDGKVWKKHRKLISETFRYEFIASQIPIISKVAKELFEKELTEVKGKHVNVLDLYERITGELVFQIFFGSDLIDSDIQGVAPTKYLAGLAALIFRNLLSPENILFGVSGVKLKLFERNRALFQKAKIFRQFIIQIVENRKKKKMENRNKKVNNSENRNPDESLNNKDFLDILLESQMLSLGTEDEFTDEEVLHEFVTFFVAGMDTTGHLLTMATYFYYYSSIEVQERVMREAEWLTKNTDEITAEKLNKAEVLTAFFKETLRKATPAPGIFDREALQEHCIGDVKIPKGTMVSCSFIINNYNNEHFKDPEKFNLNRWIPGHEDFEVAASKNPFIFTPFSAGPRNCIGQHLAMIEAKIIFSIFLTNFKFTIPEDYKMHMRVLFLYGPRDPLYIDVVNRNEQFSGESFKCI